MKNMQQRSDDQSNARGEVILISLSFSSDFHLRPSEHRAGGRPGPSVRLRDRVAAVHGHRVRRICDMTTFMETSCQWCCRTKMATRQIGITMTASKLSWMARRMGLLGSMLSGCLHVWKKGPAKAGWGASHHKEGPDFLQMGVIYQDGRLMQRKPHSAGRCVTERAEVCHLGQH